MTAKQIEQARKETTDEIVLEELKCRRMINSILIYGGSCEEDSYKYKRYLLPYIEGNIFHTVLLTKERVKELIEEQKIDIAKATIGFAGYDDEGVGYNYCKWEDD